MGFFDTMLTNMKEKGQAEVEKWRRKYEYESTDRLKRIAGDESGAYTWPQRKAAQQILVDKGYSGNW